MNRRDLIKSLPALVAVPFLGALPSRAQADAEPQTIRINVKQDSAAMVDVFVRDYKNCGRTREAIQNDREWGL